MGPWFRGSVPPPSAAQLAAKSTAATVTVTDGAQRSWLILLENFFMAV
jgi:hypothetical protein